MRNWWHRIQVIVFAVLSCLSFLRLLGVGFPTSPPDWETVHLFLFPGKAVTSFFGERPLLFFLCVVFALTAKSAYRKRRYAFTNLSNVVTIDLITPDGKEALVIYEQKIRANHPKITAYFTTSYAGDGTVPKAGINGWLITHNNIRLDSNLEIIGDDKNCDIIQISEFPFSTIFDVLPDFIRWDFIQRHVEQKHYNCFNNQDDFYEVVARYPNKLITLKGRFHADHAPKKVRGQRIMFNGIADEEARPVTEGNKIIYSVAFRDFLVGERVRISWTNQ